MQLDRTPLLNQGGVHFMISQEPISVTMAAALMIAREHGGRLIRAPGGYWTFEGCPWNGIGPEKYFGTTTIDGLVRRGYMRYSQWRKKSRRHGQFPIEVETVEAETA